MQFYFSILDTKSGQFGPLFALQSDAPDYCERVFREMVADEKNLLLNRYPRDFQLWSICSFGPNGYVNLTKNVDDQKVGLRQCVVSGADLYPES